MEKATRKRKRQEPGTELTGLKEEMGRMKEMFKVFLETFQAEQNPRNVDSSEETEESDSGSSVSVEQTTERETEKAIDENKENKDSEKVNVETETVEAQPDSKVLQLLGDDPQESKALNLNIHSSLKSRWEYWIKKGLVEAEKKDLLVKYNKSDFLETPKLNVEIKAILKESAIKRDNYMSEVHQLAATALTSLGDLLSTLMTEKESIDQTIFIGRVRDAASCLVEICHRQTESRKAFVIPGLSKEFKYMASEAKTDKFLFGQEFGLKIKETESLEKITRKMKKPNQFNQKTNLNAKSLSGRRPPLTQAGNSNVLDQARPRLFFKPRSQNQRVNQNQFQGKFKQRNGYK